MIPREILKKIRQIEIRTNRIVHPKLLFWLMLALSGVWAGCSSVGHQTRMQANWGRPADGLQLSLRFDRETYSVGQEISATATFRNVTHAHRFAPCDIPRFDTEIIVINKNGQRLELKKPEGWNEMTAFQRKLTKVVQNPKFITIAPGAQNEHRVKLNELFDLTVPGTYEIGIHYRFVSDGGPIVNLSSGRARITISADYRK